MAYGEQRGVQRALKDEDKAYLDDPPQPKLSGKIPKLTEARRVDGVRFFPPTVPMDGLRTQILIVNGTVSPEEASAVTVTEHGFEIPKKPRLGAGPIGQIIKDCVDRFPNLHSGQAAFVSLVPWLLPKNRRYKPNKDELAFCKERLREVVEELKPDVVLAFGKTAFDALIDYKIGFDDARAGWFSTAGSNRPLYLLDAAVGLLTKPWTIDTLITDLKEVNRMVSEDKGEIDNQLNYEVIDTPEQLQALVDRWRAEKRTCFSVDCEWKGTHHVDGFLRSIQFCWSDKDACYLRFFDETGRTFLEYADAKRILGSYLNEEGITYIGHHFAADSPWMEYVLGLKIHGRCVFDSEYAQQVVDEYAPLGLEWIALRYTNFGRYDMDLVMWKRANKLGEDDGYGFIPDEILIPYAVKDVVVVWRAREHLERRMRQEDTLPYYQSIIVPFISDVFHGFVTTGLPVDRDLLNNTRDFMNWAYAVLMDDFRKTLVEHSNRTLGKRCGTTGDLMATVASSTRDLGNFEAAKNSVMGLATAFGAEPIKEDDPCLLHWLSVPEFNIRSHPQMSRWLFEVLGLEPVKTTSNKEQGIPAMLWEKAKELPEKAKALLKPAVDKETIEILADQEPEGLLHRLLAVSNIGNQCKGFLKAGERDADGELVKENGLAKFVASDNRIHGQFSLTETGRPRSWKPNTLNLSSYHNKGVEAGLNRVLSSGDHIEIPDQFVDLFGSPEEQQDFIGDVMAKALAENLAAGMDENEATKKARKKALAALIKARVPTVRSVVSASAGRCYVESDYKTAEIRSMAFVFEDPELIRLMVESDPFFALTKNGDPVRLAYPDDAGISEEHKNPAFLMAYCEEGKAPVPVAFEDLLRDDNGELVHPGYDLHWSLAEMVNGKPREMMSNKKDRGAAKVGNFCIAEGELVLTRKGWKPIESVLGCDLLWDGVEWVHHDGVVYSGEKEIVEYQGLRATRLHDVWTSQGKKIKLGEASAQRLELCRSEKTCPGVESAGVADLSGYGQKERERLLLRFDALRSLRRAAGQGVEELGKGIFVEVPVPGRRKNNCRISRHPAGGGKNSGIPLRRDGAAVHKGHPRVLRKVQGPGYPGGVRVTPGLHRLGVDEMAGRDLQKEGFRSRGQRRELFEGKSQAGRSHDKSTQPTVHAGCSHRACQGVYDSASGGSIHGAHGVGATEVRPSGGGDPKKAFHQLEGGSEKIRTYDIVNAGPRRRFTCQGWLVSNSSAYGAVGTTLERRIEAQTGVKPEPGTGERILEALAKRQPITTTGLDEVAKVPARGETLRAASGRVRHFPIHSRDLSGMPWRVRKAYLRAMGNEARNFFPQESVAATLARACFNLESFYRANGMEARVIAGLYDSVVTECPLEERHVCSRAHTLFMDTINFWKYGKRYMSYPIDTEFNYRWSWRPSKPDQKKLADRTWCAMDPDREQYLLGLLDNIEEMTFKFQPHIKGALNRV